MKCENIDGKMNCPNCEYYHFYYGCVIYLYSDIVHNVQSDIKNIVQIDNDQTLDK